ncbi:MAG: hypothetical protein AB7J13_15265 [Pyrinomonadaceae bacterium]
MLRLKLVILIASTVALTAPAAFGQNAKPTPKPKPLATPPLITGAEIITRAGDLVQVPVETATPEPEVAERGQTDPNVRELTERIRKLEGGQKDPYDEKQKRMLLNLDILTRAEQRAEALRKQLFEMIEKESTVSTRLQQIEYDSRPEVIDRTLQLAGSLRPEEVRENRRRALAAEKTNLQSLLTEIQATRANLSASLVRADQMVDRLRLKLEKDIEESFLSEESPQN